MEQVCGHWKQINYFFRRKLSKKNQIILWKFEVKKTSWQKKVEIILDSSITIIFLSNFVKFHWIKFLELEKIHRKIADIEVISFVGEKKTQIHFNQFFFREKIATKMYTDTLSL